MTRRRFRLPRVFSLGLTLAAIACSTDSQAPRQRDVTPVRASHSETGTAMVTNTPAPPAETGTSLRQGTRGPNDLTGRWKMFIRTTTWTVQLTPAAGLPGEYEGTADREETNAPANVVTLKVGAVLAKGRIKAWLGPGIVVCDAPFSATRPIAGTCTVAIGEGAPGPFRAERVP